MRRTAVAGIALILIGAGCAQPVASPVDDASGAPTSSAAASAASASASFAVNSSLTSPGASAEPSVEVLPSPTAESAPGPTPTRTPEPVRVAFTKAISPKRWPVKPFTVTAKASNAAPIGYAANGPCTVTPKGGRVEVDRVGQCVVTARTASGDPASASMTIQIRPAKPKITFADKSVRWDRQFSYTLKAKVSPSIPLKYGLIDAGSGPDCQVSRGKLTLSGFQPALTTDCRVRVAAAKTSPNYVAPKAVVATIHVDFPAWDVDAISPGVVDYSEHGSLVEVTVREHSGNALGMWADGDDRCNATEFSPNPPPLGTTTYVVVLDVIDPGTDGYVCEMTARALPPDYFDPGGTPSDSFSVTVVP